MSIKKINSNLDLGLSMSRASYTIEQTNRSVKAETGSVAIRNLQFPLSQLEMEISLFQLKKVSKKCENPFERLFRPLLNLFGIVTNYQKLINEINILECNAELTEMEHLKQLEKERTEALDNIEAALTKISEQFTAVEKEIQNLDTRAALAMYQKHLTSMEGPLDTLFSIYRGDAPQLKLIEELAERYDNVLNRLSEITRPKLPGGISNGGNTCYLASAMQAINNVAEYRDLFKNTLQQRERESKESFEERLSIQEAGFSILQKIERGKKVSGKEINSLRQACYNHTEDGKRVIESLRGQTDSMETLGRLLSVLDYKEPEIQFIYEDTVGENDFEIVDDGKERDASTLEEVKRYAQNGSFTLSAYQYMNAEVSMDILFKNFWKDETLENYLLMELDEDNSEVVYKRYKTATRKKSLNQDTLPKVLRVTVQQMGEQRARIAKPETVCLSDRTYRLAAVIEHKPGHYVAHVVRPGGMITANDSLVHSRSSSSIPGYGYIYIMDKQVDLS